MSTPSKPDLRERLTVLEPIGPDHLTPEQTGWRVVDVGQHERFTMLEPKGPTHLTDEQKTWPVLELADPGGPPGAPLADDEVELLAALHRLRAVTGRPVATWREVFAVVKGLGYRKDPSPAPEN